MRARRRSWRGSCLPHGGTNPHGATKPGRKNPRTRRRPSDQSRNRAQNASVSPVDNRRPNGLREAARETQSAFRGLGVKAGASVANTAPLRVMDTFSPSSIHFATSAKWFRKSRTVAVFIVIQECITHAFLSTGFIHRRLKPSRQSRGRKPGNKLATRHTQQSKNPPWRGRCPADSTPVSLTSGPCCGREG